MYSLRLYTNQSCVHVGIRCNCAKKTLVDPLGHHFISGCHKDGMIKRQHDNLVHEFKRLFEWAGLQTIREKHYCFTQTNPEKLDRPDLSLPHPPKRNKKLILDAVISNPVEGSQSAVPKAISRASAVKVNIANIAAFNKKNLHYQQMAADNTLGFLTLAFESTGRIHPESLKFIKDVALYAVEIRKINYSICINYILTCISSVLQKELANNIQTRCGKINGRTRSSVIDNDCVNIVASSPIPSINDSV